MATDYFKKLINDLDDTDTSLASAGVSSAEFSGFIDTGSYMFNAALSGSIYGGIPNNKVLVMGGDPAVGKSFFALGIVKNFLDSNKKARVFYYDTESAITTAMMVERGIDIHRVAISEPATIEQFRSKCSKLLDIYTALDKIDRFPMLIVLDSLSALSSNKEIGDIGEGKDTRDMTKPGLIKGAFRVLRLKMAKVQVPIIVTNHVYAVIGAYVPTKEMAGGSGAKYAADAVVYLSKTKEKAEDKSVIGNVIHAQMEKSRLSREHTKVDTRILYDGGLDRYYGLLKWAEQGEVVKKEGNKYVFPDGTKAFEKQILAEPERFWTKDVLDAVDVYVKTQFTYSAGADTETENNDPSETE